MNLLECLRMYQEILKSEGLAAAKHFLNDTVAEELHSHIIASFDEKGTALHTIPRENENGTPISFFLEDGQGGFNFKFEKLHDYVMDPSEPQNETPNNLNLIQQILTAVISRTLSGEMVWKPAVLKSRIDGKDPDNYEAFYRYTGFYVNLKRNTVFFNGVTTVDCSEETDLCRMLVSVIKQMECEEFQAAAEKEVTERKLNELNTAEAVLKSLGEPPLK